MFSDLIGSEKRDVYKFDHPFAVADPAFRRSLDTFGTTMTSGNTAELLKKLMEARGLSTEGHAIDPKVCFDCLQTRTDQARAAIERDRRMEAEFAAAQKRAGTGGGR